MIEPEQIGFDLPRLDRTHDPRGGASAWALLTVSAAVFGSAILAVILAVPH